VAIQVGDKLPSVKLKIVTPSGQMDATTEELFAGKKIVVFGVPGAFTPVCSSQHLPGYIRNAEALRAKGVDRILCVSVNDIFVMEAWARDRGAGDAVTLVADGSAEFTRAVGLDFDAGNFGMGTRSQRYALVAEDGVVTHLAIETPMKFDVSSVEAILAAL